MTYEVSVVRDGSWWMATVPALGAVTQTRALGGVDAAARELVALETGTGFGEVDINVHVEPEAASGGDR
ncbi:hypothetical protein [Rhodococcoides corynebacterioides]|uniref:hypothetical protein n=1 Tax=Rhodococcoides corynebacterioides TaxID=53972 RepID=UPI001C9B1BE5|nr:hypothetical protein [Rhodococcus corynebacterioides]MBY6364318.1 hypothetical protein [Rhodococcus corynebacterioides]